MSEIFFNLIFFYYSNIYFRRIFQRHLKLTLNVNYEKQPNRYTSVVPPHCRFDCRKKRCYNVTFDNKKKDFNNTHQSRATLQITDDYRFNGP